jgi:hypothetical protein
LVLASTRENGIPHFLHIRGTIYCREIGVHICRKPLKNVTNIRTFGAPAQGQKLDVQESKTAKSALRDDWTLNVPHHTLEVVLEVTLEHMCTGLRPRHL